LATTTRTALGANNVDVGTGGAVGVEDVELVVVERVVVCAGTVVSGGSVVSGASTVVSVVDATAEVVVVASVVLELTDTSALEAGERMSVATMSSGTDVGSPATATPTSTATSATDAREIAGLTVRGS